MWKVDEKEVKNNCHLSEKAEEEQKEAKEAAVLSNALIAVHKFQEIKQRDPLDEFHLLNLN